MILQNVLMCPLLSVRHSRVYFICEGKNTICDCILCLSKIRKEKKRYSVLSLGASKEQATSVVFKAINLALASYRAISS